MRFQLPLVALGIFTGILVLILLFIHEMKITLTKTARLKESFEVNDYVAEWNNKLSKCAFERTLLVSTGDNNDLRTFQVAMNEINEIYGKIESISRDTLVGSAQSLRALHDKNVEYLNLLDGFAKDQTAQMMANRAKMKETFQASLVPKEKRKVTKTMVGSKKTKAIKLAKNRKVIRPAPLVKPVISKPVKQINLDSATNEVFKSYEVELQRGLEETQKMMTDERNNQLKSLGNWVDRVKNRLIYSLLVMLALVGYVTIVLKWKILDPMKVLKAGVVEIGHGALGHQVTVKTKNEIGELAEVFNRMSIQLDEKRNAEVRLKRLEAIEQIVRSVNHEINNPLMIISGNAEYLLAVMETSGEGIKSKLNSIVAEVRRIFLVTQRLKEIKEPMTENYIGTKDQMIDLLRSSQIRKRDF